MNKMLRSKRSEYNKTEYTIILAAVLFTAITVLMFANDAGMTGYVTRDRIPLIINETNTTNETITPIQEKPAEITAVQEEPTAQIQTGCVTPYSGMSITTDTTFCQGTYYLNQAYFAQIDSYATLLINNSFITLNCNNSIIVGDNSGIGLQTSTAPSVNNVRIINCIFMNYSLPIYIIGQSIKNSHHILLENVTVRGGRGTANILILGCDNCSFRNVDSSNAKNISSNPLPPHGIYVSGGTGVRTGNDIIIENSRFENNSASGIRISDQNERYHLNLTVRNTIIANNLDSGLAINACKNCLFRNNTIYENKNRGISIGTTTITESDGLVIENNTFYNNSYNDYILWGSKNNIIRNNHYISDLSSVNLRTENVYNYSISENLTYLKIIYQNNNPYSPSAGTTSDYAYLKNIKFTNNKITFNMTIPYNDIKNTSNGVILASNVNTFSITLSPNQQIEVGDFVADPVAANNPPVMNSVSLSNNLTCITDATDTDGDSLTTSIEWYYNTTLNKTGGINQINYTGEHYCKARAYDGTNYSNWMTSNTIIINATIINETPVINETINVTINETINETINVTINSPIISNLSLDDNLSCQGVVDKLVNLTIDYYLNDTINVSSTQEINGSFTTTTQRFNGTWYCQVLANDGFNTTSAGSNIIIINETIPIINETINETINITINETINITSNETINETTPVVQEQPSRSSGGGGGSSIIKTSNTSNVTNKTSSKPNTKEYIKIESEKKNPPNKAVDDSIVEEPEIVQQPIIEQPKTLISSVWERNKSFYTLITILFIIISIISIVYSKPIMPNPQIEQYTIKALQSGYSYDAIRHVLKQHFSQDVIDHHFHKLRRMNIKPVIRFHKPVEKELYNKGQYLTQVTQYVTNQRHNGFKDKHIKKVLLTNGYPKSLVKEVFENA